ncbi:MAG: ComF family protein [Candidatus Omnitrophota bacterium]|nr:MAG: ComF family protein [Candidatus Omnitrophota bacterium]
MKAGRPAKSQNHAFICKDCQASGYFFKKAHSACIYEGVIKECIHLFKYNSKLSLSGPLAELMIDFAGRFLDMRKVDLILPVPLYSAKERRRQFNQAGILSESLAKAFSKQAHNKTLIKIKATQPQINLSRTERLKNIKGAFKVKNKNVPKNKNVLLVDDVLTTGATVNECAKALHKAGANRIEVFTLARKA